MQSSPLNLCTRINILASLIPVIIVMTILPWILLCGAAIAAFLMCKRCRKTKKKKIKPRGNAVIQVIDRSYL